MEKYNRNCIVKLCGCKMDDLQGHLCELEEN